MPAGRFCVRETSDIPAEGGYGAKERLILTLRKPCVHSAGRREYHESHSLHWNCHPDPYRRLSLCRTVGKACCPWPGSVSAGGGQPRHLPPRGLHAGRRLAPWQVNASPPSPPLSPDRGVFLSAPPVRAAGRDHRGAQFFRTGMAFHQIVIICFFCCSML